MQNANPQTQPFSEDVSRVTLVRAGLLVWLLAIGDSRAAVAMPHRRSF